MLERIGVDPDFLGRIVTGDESWVFQYDQETKRQSPAVDVPKFTTTEESVSVKVKNQDHTDHFLRPKGFGASRVCASGPNSKSALLSASPQPPQRLGSPLQTSSLESQVLDAPS